MQSNKKTKSLSFIFTGNDRRKRYFYILINVHSSLFRLGKIIAPISILSFPSHFV